MQSVDDVSVFEELMLRLGDDSDFIVTCECQLGVNR